MKKISLTYLIILIVGTLFSASALARGGGGGGGGGHGGGGHGGGGGGHFGGGHYGGGHFGGGHYGGGYYGGMGIYGLGYGYMPGYYGGYYGGGYPYYGGYPSVAIPVPTTPPVYIEQSQQPSVQHYDPGYWYYCDNPAGYYPQVKDCRNTWQQVAPTSPPPPR